MDLNPSDEQVQLVEAFEALYAKESPSERVRSAEATGFDADLWSTLIETGAVSMAADEAAGGWGATLLDLALVAEQHGRALGSAPIIDAQVAVRLLGRLDSGAAKDLLVGHLAGERLVSVALHPPIGGVLRMVPAGAVADSVIFFDVGELFAMDLGAERAQLRTTGAMPVADLPVAGATSLASGAVASEVFERARDEWMALTANALVGLANRALEIGVEYVKERHAFGTPIGSFQAVAHGLANARTSADGAMLLSREAAWAADEDPERFSELARLAFGFATEAAREASYASEHYHGGYGFMAEYDIQLYWRRAHAWPALMAEPDVIFASAERARLDRLKKGA